MISFGLRPGSRVGWFTTTTNLPSPAWDDKITKEDFSLSFRVQHLENVASEILTCSSFSLNLFWTVDFKRTIPGLFFSLFSSVQSSWQSTNAHDKFCLWLDLNCRPLVLVATARPTEPPPLPFLKNSCLHLSLFLFKGSFTLLRFPRVSAADGCVSAGR